MTRTIAILQNNHNHPNYTGRSLATGGVSGTESSVIHLAEALAARGHRVYALNRIERADQINGVFWMPLANKADLPRLDIAIGINSTRIFDGVHAARTINWLHNPPTIRQQLKRRSFLALLRHRPHAVLLGAYHSNLLRSWLPYRGRSIIYHGIGDAFFCETTETRQRPMKAIFTSQPSRGLALVAEAWRGIAAKLPGAKLHVFYPQSKYRDAANACGDAPGVMMRGSVSRHELAHELKTSRVMLIPGVADETFCLSAAEATAAGVPIVTFGRGALCERVRNGETGFITATEAAFEAEALRLLTNDELWTKLHRACVSDASLAPWSERALEWEALFEAL